MLISKHIDRCFDKRKVEDTLDIRLRNMTLDDLTDIMEIELLSFSVPWSRNAFVEELTVNDKCLYLVAEHEKNVIGYIGMWKIFDEGHITNVAVHPKFRGRKVGCALIKELEAHAKNALIQRVTLEVRESNTVAISLYTKFGFQRAGIRKGYYSDTGENALIMWKTLEQR